MWSHTVSREKPTVITVVTYSKQCSTVLEVCNSIVRAVVEYSTVQYSTVQRCVNSTAVQYSTW